MRVVVLYLRGCLVIKSALVFLAIGEGMLVLFLKKFSEVILVWNTYLLGNLHNRISRIS